MNSATLVRPSARRTTGRRRLVGASWPLALATVGLPFWWAVGIGPFVWIIVALPLALQLRQRRHLLAPRGFGLWLLFLGWVMVSAFQLDAATQLIAFTFRLLVYTGAAVLFVYAYNAPERVVPDRLVMDLVVSLWFGLVVLGLVANVVPDLSFHTPVEGVLPGALAFHPFVHSLVHADLAQTHVFLGFPVARPAGPFTYTNEWGSMYALLAPLVWCWFRHEPRGPRRSLAIGLAVASVVPVVMSLNRGLWLSLSAAVAYATARLTVRGQRRVLRRVLAGVAIMSVLVVATPLGTLASDRLATGHSDSGRISLVTQSAAGVTDAPILGHGGTRDQVDGTGPDVGTHGQLWLVAVSQGLPGAAMFLIFLLVVLHRTGRRGLPPIAFWSHVTVLVAVVQLPFYALMPAQLPVVFLVAGTALRAERRMGSTLGATGGVP